jgi:hypothetical protein
MTPAEAEHSAALDHIRASPGDGGTVELIVARPAVGERRVLTTAVLDETVGLVGDTWNERSSSRTADGSPHPDMQLNIMNARAVALVAGEQDRWPLAGDQLYVDLDVSEANLPAGTRLMLGTAIIEVTAEPHTGCAKFSQRFGVDAVRLVNSPAGKELRLRGINARVVTGGVIAAGDTVRKL